MRGGTLGRRWVRETYCVWDNRTDRIVALDQPVRKCVELLGISEGAFRSYISRGCKYLTIIRSDKIESEDDEYMNKITIIGNLTKNPELRSTQDGVSVCGFSVAVNRPKSRTNPDPGADYFNVNAWRGLGENCAKYLEKGRKVCVVGRISLRTWEKDGKHGASLEVLAEDVEFLSSRGEPRTDPETGFEIVDDLDGLV